MFVDIEPHIDDAALQQGGGLFKILAGILVNKEEVNTFIQLADNHHQTIKFTAEIADAEITFLDTCVYKDPFSSNARTSIRQ